LGANELSRLFVQLKPVQGHRGWVNTRDKECAVLPAVRLQVGSPRCQTGACLTFVPGPKLGPALSAAGALSGLPPAGAWAAGLGMARGGGPTAGLKEIR
jgi:hypothetical protein